jgi:predicted secreted Zn-dependent protease
MNCVRVNSAVSRLVTSDEMSEEQRHLRDRPLDRLRGHEERHQVAGRQLAGRHEVAAIVQGAQNDPVQEEVGPA